MMLSIRGLLACACAATAAAARARVIALKTLTGLPGTAAEPGLPVPEYFVVGRPMTVRYTLFNIGGAAAKDVGLDDDWPSGALAAGCCLGGGPRACAPTFFLLAPLPSPADSFDIVEGSPRNVWAHMAP
jgi:hypothetical protein